jgi:hypothetical protein
MKELNFKPPSRAALCLLLCSCGGDLLVGEKRCYGDGVDCSSQAPTLVSTASTMTGSSFDVVATRSVPATWIYDLPVEPPFLADTGLALAPGGGVWLLYDLAKLKLERVNAAGEPVESHPLSLPAYLWVDDELSPVIVSWLYGYVKQARLSPLGEVVEWTTGYIPPVAPHRFFVSGPERRVRVAEFLQRGSYLAEYSAQGELRWKQSGLRDARDFPFEAGASGVAPAAAYQVVALSDGAIAVGVPKARPEALRAYPLWGLGGIDDGRAQGITLVEPDGTSAGTFYSAGRRLPWSWHRERTAALCTRSMTQTSSTSSWSTGKDPWLGAGWAYV